MATSKIVKIKCPKCGKDIVESSRIEFDDYYMITSTCGHSIFADKLEATSSYDTMVSSDGKSLRDYQTKGIDFALEANGRVLIADEQGLGKTIQAIGYTKFAPRAETFPIVVVTKTTVTRQWFHEFNRWCGREGYLCQIIQSGKEKALPGFDVYIMSWDMFKVDGMFSMLINQPQTLIMDEVQAIKNHLSQRAKAAMVNSLNFKHIIALSGTPIKNNAGEYFTILNILQPTRFSEYNKFIRTYCNSVETSYGYKVGGLSNSDKFREETKDFIIRRTRKEAAPEIPEVDRQFFHVDFSKKLQGSYDKILEELEEVYYGDEDENTTTALIAIMTKLRRLTGISKVQSCVEFVEEFLENEPSRKLVIFLHHHDVVTLLEADLNRYLKDKGLNNVLNLHAGLSGDSRAMLVDKFKNDSQARLMIASTLAAGEALNLQFCSRAIMLERQWNPANEEQAEGRFARLGQEDNIVVTYMIATETIDEYFTELVEQKRAIVSNTLDNKSIEWDSNSLMKELAGVMLAKGGKRFSLSGVAR